MEKTEQIGFQIKAIELLNSSLSAPNKPLPLNAIFQFDINLEHRIGLENRILIVVCNVNVFDESKESSLGNIRTSCIYEIQDLPSFFKEDKKQFDLPEPLITTLNSISISTTRGMMFSFFRGTFLHHAILPVIDPIGFKSQNQ
jgi:hypothetical protein